jgi:hypothetical protein
MDDSSIVAMYSNLFEKLGKSKMNLSNPKKKLPKG